jgi:hypothetical protein
LKCQEIFCKLQVNSRMNDYSELPGFPVPFNDVAHRRAGRATQ